MSASDFVKMLPILRSACHGACGSACSATNLAVQLACMRQIDGAVKKCGQARDDGSHGCPHRPALWPVKPNQAPALLDDPAFFGAMAARAAATGLNPDLLFFAFYFQPVRMTGPCSLHTCLLPPGRGACCSRNL